MPSLEAEKLEVGTPETSFDNSPEAKSAMDDIAGAGYRSGSASDPEPAEPQPRISSPTKTASDGVNAPKEASTPSAQPGRDGGVTKQDDKKPASAASIADNKQVTPPAPVEADAQSTEDAERIRKEMLGLSDTRPESIETLRERYQASSTEAHALREQVKNIESYLDSRGLKLVTLRDGSIGTVPTEKYASEFPKEEIPDVFSKLSPEERELFVDNPAEAAKLVALRTAQELLAKRPRADADTANVVLSNNEQIQCFQKLVDAKLSNGKPAFPNANEEDIRSDMIELYADPKMDSFAAWMNQSPENYTQGLKFLYASVWRVHAPERAKKADAATQQDQTKDKDRKKLSADAASATPDALKTGGVKSVEDEMLDTIAGAKFK